MKKTLLGTVLMAVASGIVYAIANGKPKSPQPVIVPEERAPVVPSGWSTDAMSKTDVATRRFMMYFMLPLWLVVGILDYIWHRRTKIETTSGTEESVIHALMMTEVGVPILVGLFLEINAGVIALMIAAFFVHELTAFWDVGFAVKRRRVLPKEQHTHSFLEGLPFCAVAFVMCLHWDQFRALVGQGTEPPRFEMRMKRPPFPARYTWSILGAVGLCIVLPYAEELWRCRKAQQRGLVGRDTPECATELFGNS